MTPKILQEIVSATKILQTGGVVAFPTETVYGLGADVSNALAVNRIFEIKGRPPNHPLIVHFSNISNLQHWTQEVPEAAWKLAEHFWPGPLTLILPRGKHILPIVTGGQNMVGLRIPNHPIALALLESLGATGALAAPSANRFGRISPTTAAHVTEELGSAVDMILDGGACKVGLESTIVSFNGKTPIVLRPGGIPLAALADILNENIALSRTEDSAIRVSGTLASHYAPLTPLEICTTKFLPQRVRELKEQGLHVALIGWSTEIYQIFLNMKAIHYCSLPQESVAYGRKLYATLRRFDNEHFDRLLVEAPPNRPAWLAIIDRLQRASHALKINTEIDDHNTKNLKDSK